MTCLQQPTVMSFTERLSTPSKRARCEDLQERGCAKRVKRADSKEAIVLPLSSDNVPAARDCEPCHRQLQAAVSETIGSATTPQVST